MNSEIQEHTFCHNFLLNAEVYGYSSVCSFGTNDYVINTIDNSHGQMESRVTEEGTFKVKGKKATLYPKTRLVCPKLIPEWGYKGELVYTDVLKSDSFYITELTLCYKFSEYVYVNRDTLSNDKLEKLGLFPRTYKILESKLEVKLQVIGNHEKDLLQYPTQDYRWFKRMPN